MNDNRSAGTEPPDGQTRPDVLEPEVLPPKSRGSESRGQQRPGSDRVKFILIGLTLDLLDYLTLGPIGLRVGFFVGALAAFGLLGFLRVPMAKRILISIGAGVYCMMPGTAPLPLGTLLGALLKLR